MCTDTPKELHSAEKKCIALKCIARRNHIITWEWFLMDAKSELAELEKEVSRQRARHWEARESLDNSTFINDVGERPDEKSSSELDMHQEPRAKKAKRAHAVVDRHWQAPD